MSDVYTATRAILGDTNVAAGEVYKDAILQPHYQFAYSELFRAMQAAQSPRVRNESYYNLPPNTSYLNPATASIFNLGQVESVEERGQITSWSVATYTLGAGYATLTTTTPTTLVSGDVAVLFGLGGVTDDANGIWVVTVNNPSSIRLDGCVATVTGALTGGTLSFSAEFFTQMSPVSRISGDFTPSSTLQIYAWETGVFRFPPATAVVQLRITYSLSGNAPTATTASTGIDDCLGFLSYRVAGMAAMSRGMVQRAQQYRDLSVGPNWESNQMPGGILNQLLLPGVQNMQRLPPAQRRPPPFGIGRRRRWLVW